MDKTYKINEGPRATINGGQLTFSCDPDDIDTAYDVLAENIHINNQSSEQDLVDFQNAADDNVRVMLDDMKRMGFISDWEVSNESFKMIYTICEGPKASIGDDGMLTIECGPKDVDGAYNKLMDNVELIDKNGKSFPFDDYFNDSSLARTYLSDFQNAAAYDRDVRTFLDDLEKMGFIGSWEISRPDDMTPNLIWLAKWLTEATDTSITLQAVDDPANIFPKNLIVNGSWQLLTPAEQIQMQTNGFSFPLLFKLINKIIRLEFEKKGEL